MRSWSRPAGLGENGRRREFRPVRTSRGMPAAVVGQSRQVHAAGVAREGAARVEQAARRRVHGARDVALEQRAFAHDGRIGQRHGGQQGARVGMARIAEELVGRRRLHDLAEVHYGDAIGDVFHNREIVADEDVGQPEALLQRAHQVDDLRLDRHVERGDRLVGHDQLGLDRERAGDRQALALAAGEFVRIAARMVGPQPDQLEQLADAGAPRRLVAGKSVKHQRLAQHGAHGHARIERGVGVLEDHLHALAARRASPRRSVPAGPRPRSAPGRPRVRSGAAPGGRPSTCRSPIRPRWPASRRR